VSQFASLDIVPVWARMNEGLIKLVDYIPEDKLDWSPKEGLWNLRGIVIHISMARHNWMAHDVKDGEETPNVLRDGQTKEGMKGQLQLSWDRMERFLADPTKLAAVYSGRFDDALTGHWLAYHGLEHDIHHRADVFHYLALLGIEHPDVGTP